MTSNRLFGILFTIITIIGAYYFNKNLYPAISYLLFFTSLTLLLLSIFSPMKLQFMRNLWISFGLLLSKITNPIFLFIIFYFIISPYAILLRVFYKNILSVNNNLTSNSYWICNTSHRSTNFFKQH